MEAVVLRGICLFLLLWVERGFRDAVEQLATMKEKRVVLEGRWCVLFEMNSETISHKRATQGSGFCTEG